MNTLIKIVSEKWSLVNNHLLTLSDHQNDRRSNFLQSEAGVFYLLGVANTPQGRNLHTGKIKM
jgi:hypothetical protein